MVNARGSLTRMIHRGPAQTIDTDAFRAIQGGQAIRETRKIGCSADSFDIQQKTDPFEHFQPGQDRQKLGSCREHGRGERFPTRAQRCTQVPALLNPFPEDVFLQPYLDNRLFHPGQRRE